MRVASTLGAVLEIARFMVRELRVEYRKKQLKHTDSGPSSLIPNGVGRRIIVIVEAVLR